MGTTAEQALAGIATGVTTGTAASQAGALTQAWNGAALMKEVQAQTQITQAFSAQMPKAIAEYATKQALALQKELANKPNDPELLAELDNWVEGGTYRVALHTLSGALSGGVGGALGAMSVSSAAKSLNEIAGDRVTHVAGAGYERSGGQRGGLRACPRRGAWYRYPRRGTSGAATALAVDTNNRQFHRAETQKLAVLKSGKSEAEEHRLDAAACAFVKCSDGVPTNDPQYAKLQALQKKGKAYTAELQLLKNTGEFIYSPWVDKAGSITSQDEAFRRVGGGINLLAGSAGVFGGAVLASGGAVSCPMSLGAGCGLAVVGVGVAGLSAQQASNGNAALWGPYVSTEGARVVASFGTLTFPGEANPLRNSVVEGITFGAIVAAGKYGPAVLSAAEAKIAQLRLPSITNKTISDALLPDADFADQFIGRPDIVDHLTTTTVSSKQISGGHDMVNFIDALSASGGAIFVVPKELASGIFEVEYSIKNSTKTSVKTIYDPIIYPNMPTMTVDAVNKGLINFQINGKIEQLVVVDGVQFNVQISLKLGAPATVRTAYPVGLVTKGK